MFVSLLLACLLVESAYSTVRSKDDLTIKSQIGYGLKKMKAMKSKISHVAATCDNVVEYWFKDAVIDNFAPVDSQQKWIGNG
jgi:hypothetical protein